ncbi:MAG: YjgP/YjgQ family permease [Verrucomicrobia bacterium]|nr:YjgP/YjgQ family permease [Verrucomicrobiota bacterium]
MKILNRYLFVQVASAVVMSLGLFIFVLVTGNVLRQVIGELANGRLSTPTLFELIGLISVSVIPYAMPLGMLTGVLIVLGRMSANNEIIAMKSAGMNLWRIVSPIFFVALLGVCVSGYINCFWAPKAANQYKTILKSTFREAPTRLIVPKVVFKEFPGFAIYADSREGDALKNFWLWELNDQGLPARFTHAEEATIRFVESQNTFVQEDALEITLKNATTEERSRSNAADVTKSAIRFSSIGNAPISVSLGQILGDGTLPKERRKLKWFTITELMELREIGWRADPEKDEPEKVAEDRIKIQFQMQNYLTSAMSVFSLAILGIPLGIRVSRSETFVNIGIALGLALLFYLLTTFVSWIEDPAFRPDILVWLPNILYQVVGFILLYRAAKN